MTFVRSKRSNDLLLRHSGYFYDLLSMSFITLDASDLITLGVRSVFFVTLNVGDLYGDLYYT